MRLSIIYMDRRKFVAQASVLTLGLGTSAFALANGVSSISLKVEEQEMLSEFHQLLAEYPYSAEVAGMLTKVQKINHSAAGVLDFTDATGNRISLSKTKGRLVARLH
ncbi:hypothetical protein SAMN05444359_1355 [Neolewinella agarilytica]|uniref:Uncharacterized protein n=2 Tax=Neolewinella agarilytica TaxID=478744 RepID=A0A1H9N916_9BACT|nr:hypothetical protein SAMN05444359_1355 [Neolewinella agarilytica]